MREWGAIRISVSESENLVPKFFKASKAPFGLKTGRRSKLDHLDNSGNFDKISSSEWTTLTVSRSISQDKQGF